MTVVRFEKFSLVCEDGRKLNSDEVIRNCMKNVSHSLNVKTIIAYTLEEMGYKLNQHNFRESELFNKIENMILLDEKYQYNRQEAIKKHMPRPKKNFFLGQFTGTKTVGSVRIQTGILKHECKRKLY